MALTACTAHLAWENICLSDGVLKLKLHFCPASSFLPVFGIEQTHCTDGYSETWGFDEDYIVSNHPCYLLVASVSLTRWLDDIFVDPARTLVTWQVFQCHRVLWKLRAVYSVPCRIPLLAQETGIASWAPMRTFQKAGESEAGCSPDSGSSSAWNRSNVPQAKQRAVLLREQHYARI